MESLDYIRECIENKIIPDETKITLKMYCEYFEKEIENHIIQVELSNGQNLLINNKAAHISHIMELHEFYDKTVKHKKLRFSGSFSTIQGFFNMKKNIITLDTLKKANNGKSWNRKTTKYRVLCFPFLNEALLYGQWYTFDIHKYDKETKLIPKFIVNYRIQNIQLNFCIDIDKNNSQYFCISNVIAFKSNPRIKNQDCLDIDRIIEYIDSHTINRCICHNKLYSQKLKSKNNCRIEIIPKLTHQKLIKEKCYINSRKHNETEYQIIYLKLDSHVKKYIQAV